ncbi:MAG: carbon dioxide concentrating mechanism protein [Waterburya sp.]
MIYLPPPQPSLNKDIRVSGDVEIHPTASLASGVILQAAPNQKIIIGADACIGMGAIINAAQGSINIGSGAILGAGVLIIGASKIGNNCCIGTSSTVFQSDVAPMVVVEPGSILGDSSRRIEQDTNEQPRIPSSNRQNVRHMATKFEQGEKPDSQTVQNFNKATDSSSVIQVETPTQNLVNQKKEPVVGQLYINELLITLFPHNKTSPPDPWSS